MYSIFSDLCCGLVELFSSGCLLFAQRPPRVSGQRRRVSVFKFYFDASKNQKVKLSPVFRRRKFTNAEIFLSVSHPLGALGGHVTRASSPQDEAPIKKDPQPPSIKQTFGNQRR